MDELKKKELAAGMEYVLEIFESLRVNECRMRLENGKYVGDLF